jgi:hypothetical protein
MVLGRGVALKGCAARTGKPAAALDRDTAAKRIVVMPLWRGAGSRGVLGTGALVMWDDLVREVGRLLGGPLRRSRQDGLSD